MVVEKKVDKAIFEEDGLLCLEPYDGCSFGCKYCKAFPNVEVKINIPAVLDQELFSIKEKKTIHLGKGFSECYQSIESDYKITQKCLHVLNHHNFPVEIITKSQLILQDVSILENLNCTILISIPCLNPKMAKIIEPTSLSPIERLDIVRDLSLKGIKVGVLFSPVLPFITDRKEDIEALFKASKEAGANFILDNPLEINENFLNFMNGVPKFKKFFLRYQRLYKNHLLPHGKIMQMINRNCFDASIKYDIPRSI